MLFVAFTSAYIVRQGLPTFDPHTNTVVHDWIPVPLPTLLFLVNTCVLLLSSVTIELRGDNLRGKSRWNPCSPFPEYPWARKGIFPGWR